MNDLANDHESAGKPDISDISWWDVPVFAAFWALIGVVFLQFFSRYVLNNSVSWTEEAARYLLIVVTFSGGFICARKKSHLRLDFFHLYIPKIASRILVLAMDTVSAVFFGTASWLGVSLAGRMEHQRMISVDLSRGYLFWTVAACLAMTALMTLFRAFRAPRRTET